MTSTPKGSKSPDKYPGTEWWGKAGLAQKANSEEFPTVAVRKYDEEEEGWDGGDEEESPEKPPGKKVKISQDKKIEKK